MHRWTKGWGTLQGHSATLRLAHGLYRGEKLIRLPNIFISTHTRTERSDRRPYCSFSGSIGCSITHIRYLALATNPIATIFTSCASEPHALSVPFSLLRGSETPFYRSHIQTHTHPDAVAIYTGDWRLRWTEDLIREKIPRMRSCRTPGKEG